MNIREQQETVGRHHACRTEAVDSLSTIRTGGEAIFNALGPWRPLSDSDHSRGSQLGARSFAQFHNQFPEHCLSRCGARCVLWVIVPSGWLPRRPRLFFLVLLLLEELDEAEVAVPCQFGIGAELLRVQCRVVQRLQRRRLFVEDAADARGRAALGGRPAETLPATGERKGMPRPEPTAGHRYARASCLSPAGWLRRWVALRRRLVHGCMRADGENENVVALTVPAVDSPETASLPRELQRASPRQYRGQGVAPVRPGGERLDTAREPSGEVRIAGEVGAGGVGLEQADGARRATRRRAPVLARPRPDRPG